MKNRQLVATAAALLVSLGSVAEARYFMPREARFLTPDSLGVEDGPNVYQYARANPVAYTDPTGEWSFAPADASSPVDGWVPVASKNLFGRRFTSRVMTELKNGVDFAFEILLSSAGRGFFSPPDRGLNMTIIDVHRFQTKTQIWWRETNLRPEVTTYGQSNPLRLGEPPFQIAVTIYNFVSPTAAVREGDPPIRADVTLVVADTILHEIAHHWFRDPGDESRPGQTMPDDVAGKCIANWQKALYGFGL